MVKRMTTILIVDDNVDLTDGFSIILDEEGYEVKTAYDGNTARELIESGDYDIALVDIKLPGVSGMELLAIANNSHPQKPIVLMTGYRVEQVMETVSNGSAVDVLRSPSSFESIHKKLLSIDDGILLTDIDDHELFASIPAMLSGLGKQVATINDTADIKHLTEKPDVVVMEVRQSIVRTLADYMEIVNRFGNVAALLCLDNSEFAPEGQDVLRSYNVSGCLLKPFTPEALLDLLREYEKE